MQVDVTKGGKTGRKGRKRPLYVAANTKQSALPLSASPHFPSLLSTAACHSCPLIFLLFSSSPLFSSPVASVHTVNRECPSGPFCQMAAERQVQAEGRSRGTRQVDFPASPLPSAFVRPGDACVIGACVSFIPPPTSCLLLFVFFIKPPCAVADICVLSLKMREKKRANAAEVLRFLISAGATCLREPKQSLLFPRHLWGFFFAKGRANSNSQSVTGRPRLPPFSTRHSRILTEL